MSVLLPDVEATTPSYFPSSLEEDDRMTNALSDKGADFSYASPSASSKDEAEAAALPEVSPSFPYSPSSK